MIVSLAVLAFVQIPWPAESWGAAQNLTPVEGAGTNDFHVDLSGAAWNPVTRRLWVCRNGPTGATSKLWVLREDGAGSFVVDVRSGNRGEWTGFGDFEGVTQADFAEDVVYAIVEDLELIRAYDVSTYGTAVLQQTWNMAAQLPSSGGLGAEAIAFVPDGFLAAQGFVDAAGVSRVSANGMGGLVFVGHQNGGRVYVFDLDRSDGSFDFVGAYLTGAAETAELAFDRSNGHLYALHGEGVNRIEVLSFASVPIGGERRLVEVATYLPPTGMASGTNLEGLTLVSSADGASGDRSLFFTIDDGGATSLVRFRQFPCCEAGPTTQTECTGDGAFVLACPCGNVGVAGNGCGNSRAAAGARLDACRTSTTAVVELLVSGVPPISLVYFVGSSTFAAGGFPFGDGHHCIDGQLLRLRSRNAVAGVARIGPSVGDPDLATMSGAAPGTTFHYQVLYRDVNASFCTPATMNASNAQRVIW